MAQKAWISKPTTGNVKPGTRYIASPADPFLERMEDEPVLWDRLFLATRALRQDPGCIEAHLLLAQYSPDNQQRAEHLERAVATGEAIWLPLATAKDADLTWWWDSGTRPYMRAIQALAGLQLENGDVDGAREAYGRLLDMNPNDNQGIRYLVAELDGAASPGMR